jgi:hypothetical protein
MILVTFELRRPHGGCEVLRPAKFVVTSRPKLEVTNRARTELLRAVLTWSRVFWLGAVACSASSTHALITSLGDRAALTDNMDIVAAAMKTIGRPSHDQHKARVLTCACTKQKWIVSVIGCCCRAECQSICNRRRGARATSSNCRGELSA